MAMATLTQHVARMAATTHAALRRSRLMACYRELVANEHLDREALAAYSTRRLRETIAYAYQRIPYYQRVMAARGLTPADIQTPADLTRLPILTKDIIREHFDALQPAAPPAGARILATSGSTGEPTKFLATQAMRDWHDAAKLRAWAWAGYSLGTPIVLLWGATFDHERYRSLPGRLRRFFNREHLFNAHDMSDAVCGRYVERIRRLRVKGLHGYPNSTYFLARYCHDHGIDEIRFDFVLSTAETLLEPRRQAIESAFHCPVFDHYGSRETSMVSQECPEHGGFHVSIDNGLIEITRDGDPVRPGEIGNILVTDFRNHAMPLIRYEIGDVARAATDSCPCSRPFPTFHSIEGRMSDMFTLADGRLLSPLMVTSLIYPDPKVWGKPTPEISHIRQWQIVQETQDDFTVHLVLKPGLPIERYRYIADNFRAYVHPNARVRVESVNHIPAAASGKRRPIIIRLRESDVPPN
jgi:phenylacetate-CoA ligase